MDAAGLTCSAALLVDGACVAEGDGGNSRGATATLPGIVQRMLGETGGGVDAVAVTVGPGSFTGLRAALAFAHGLGLGLGVPVVGVRVAEALRHVCEPAWGPAWVALDARRPGRIFHDSGDGMAACLLSELPELPGPVLVVGDGAAAVCAARPGAMLGEAVTVSSRAVGQVAARRLRGELGPCDPQPLYVEPPAARA